MADTSQGKTLDDVYGILSKLAESQGAIAQSQASLAQSHASLAEGQAAIAHSISELMDVQKEALEAQKENTKSLDKLLAVQEKRPPSPVHNAGRRLTDTYELLEKILLDEDVSMATLLFAQCVNKQFCSLIARSKGLQQKLFFAPLDASLQYESASADEDLDRLDLPVMNPLLIRPSVLERIPLFYDPSTRKLKHSQAECCSRLRLLPNPPVFNDRNDWSIIYMKTTSKSTLAFSLQVLGGACTYLSHHGHSSAKLE
ncbi:hypothetical protein LTR49_026858 [Elasticomyces elasticus]|nr:hypothetical protein LTR49_026858 [Elasticomyces elasticus]